MDTKPETISSFVLHRRKWHKKVLKMWMNKWSFLGEQALECVFLARFIFDIHIYYVRQAAPTLSPNIHCTCSKIIAITAYQRFKLLYLPMQSINVATILWRVTCQSERMHDLIGFWKGADTAVDDCSTFKHTGGFLMYRHLSHGSCRV